MTEDFLDIEDIPDDAAILQCGRVVTSEGVVGRVDPVELRGGD